MNNENKKRIKHMLGALLLILLCDLVLSLIVRNQNMVEEISYDKVISYVKMSEVTKIEATQNSLEIFLSLKDESEKTSVVPSLEEFSAFISEEIENGAEIEFIVTENDDYLKSFVSLITTFGLYALVIFMLPRLMSRATGGKFEVKPVESKVRFTDVAGIDEEKEQLEEIVKFLKNPQKYHEKGAKIPRGVLLVGEPGTGKTLLAKAVAGEAGVPFFQVTGSSFEEKFVGVGASRIRELFSEAKKVAPSIIFIDEIDSVAQSRYSGKSYSEQTLNQLLAEMDGFDTNDNVIVMAATNHIDILDAALIRPGRFDRHVFVPMPDLIAREKILEVHAKNKQFANEVSMLEIARKTVGFSGADLENVLNEATIYSINHGNGIITKADIDEAIARVFAGLKKKNSAITAEDRYLTAVHEAGHAIVSARVRPNVKNFGISIVPRGNAGGYNFFDESNKTYLRKSEMLKQIQVLYGGRIAEDMVFGDISSGASNDLEKASKIAHQMIIRFAMNGSFLTKIPGEAEFNNQLESSKKEEIEKILKKAYDEAFGAIQVRKSQLLELADLLMQKEYLSQEEVEKFMAEKL